ncbi:hypothetical protein BZA05DRAFT_217708 [Tricharina praecox]|uniref:uncharacterized protein n=1 Tax=Tricharina praecox TaxID=43433 RepID=UPI002220F7DD|nr:uncharacterized protein BZA05DRAFT_217708 [Tricharina praecox]KAI5855785.1 hypothetical protein BZA05DRAFT_217708 [Tricharina praecox]
MAFGSWVVYTCRVSLAGLNCRGFRIPVTLHLLYISLLLLPLSGHFVLLWLLCLRKCFSFCLLLFHSFPFLISLSGVFIVSLSVVFFLGGVYSVQVSYFSS